MMTWRRLGLHLPVRSAESELLDTFLVSAVASVLVIRVFLEATGYPQLGGGGLHVAHVLWGGFGLVFGELAERMLNPRPAKAPSGRSVPAAN